MLVAMALACTGELGGEGQVSTGEDRVAGTALPPEGGQSPPAHGTAEGPPGPLVARLAADVVAGEFPLRVTFDGAASSQGEGVVAYEWSFGDGARSTEDDGDAVHTYVGEGVFTATLTLVDTVGAVSMAELTIEVSAPGCPTGGQVVSWGNVADGGLTELSGIVSSRRAPDAWWVHEDSGQAAVLVAVDGAGVTLSEHPLPDAFEDFEDLAAAVDPVTDTPTLFLGDIGDNGHSRDAIAVWVAAEPDPRVDGALAPLRMELTYPDGPHNAETLLVDPVTFDLYIVTKVSSGRASVYVKRAPHDTLGPFVLEALGDRQTLELTATGGDVSPDGSLVAVRDYTSTARIFVRDGYRPLEDAFDQAPCEIGIHDEQQGEAIGFTPDGAGVVTVSEGGNPALYYIGL